ncbi:MAG TPA: hypothetical protein VHC97_10745 [Thermoanaerobaculia bacterium]|jgi:hypothetical protein|nr:hypothetical protein [Thermoanaerobaculia bacterium]
MTGRKVTRAEAERQVARILDQLETVRWELLGLALSLPESPDEEAEAELRRVVECVLADRIQWALGDLRSVVERPEGEEEKRSGEPA